MTLWSRPSLTRSAPHRAFDEQRKRVKIVVIDDDPNAFPTQKLQADGYTIEAWDFVDSAGLQRLEDGKFDIIILDIKGIADESVSPTGDGIGILERIKSVNPHQAVVAFSGNDYDLSYSRFWKMADDTLVKPVSVIKAKEVLDPLIREQVSIEHYWTSISAMLGSAGVSGRRIRKVERLILASARENSSVGAGQIADAAGKWLKITGAVVALATKIISLWNSHPS